MTIGPSAVLGKALAGTRIDYYARSLAILSRFALDRLRPGRPTHDDIFQRRAPLAVEYNADGRAAGSLVPPIIWMYWHDGQPTLIVSIVEAQLARLNPGYEIRRISRADIVRWLPDFDVPASDISIQHFSDLLRLDLLHRYGGIWVDASLLFFVPMSGLFDGQLDGSETDCDLFAFYIERFSAHRAPPIVENWFLAAPPASPVIAAWQAALEPMRQGGEKAQAAALRARPDYAALKQDLLMEDYLVSHIGLQQALAACPSYRLRLIRAEDEAFALQVAGDWDAYDLIRRLLARPYHGQPPRMIKLAGYDRHLADLVMRRGIEHPQSLLGRLRGPGPTD